MREENKNEDSGRRGPCYKDAALASGARLGVDSRRALVENPGCTTRLDVIEKVRFVERPEERRADDNDNGRRDLPLWTQGSVRWQGLVAFSRPWPNFRAALLALASRASKRRRELCSIAMGFCCRKALRHETVRCFEVALFMRCTASRSRDRKSVPQMGQTEMSPM